MTTNAAHGADERNRRSLRLSMSNGVLTSAMSGCVQDYLTPFALLMGASASHIGFLSAVPSLASSVMQLNNPDLVQAVKSRKKIVAVSIALQAIVLVLMALMAVSHQGRPGIFVILVILFGSLGTFALPAWESFLSDIIKKEVRGAYLGWRIRILGFVTIGATFLSGALLQIFRRIDAYYGFALLFGAAFVFRLLSLRSLLAMDEPPLAHKKEDAFTFIDFLRRIRKSNFGRFVLFVSMMSFAAFFSGPYFSVLMLRDLKFSYFLYMLLMVAALCAANFSIARWGREADRIGNLKILTVTARLVGLVPLLWLINRHPAYLALVEIFAGIIWGGFNLCASNYIYDAVTPEKRTRCIAYFNVINGLSISAGALLGGFLIPVLPPLFGNSILTLFVISAAMRFAVGFAMPPLLKEVRSVEKIRSHRLLLNIMGLRPLVGAQPKVFRY